MEKRAKFSRCSPKVPPTAKKKPNQRKPLEDLNNPTLSLDAPKGCLSFFLPNSSKTTLPRSKSLPRNPNSLSPHCRASSQKNGPNTVHKSKTVLNQSHENGPIRKVQDTANALKSHENGKLLSKNFPNLPYRYGSQSSSQNPSSDSKHHENGEISAPETNSRDIHPISEDPNPPNKNGTKSDLKDPNTITSNSSVPDQFHENCELPISQRPIGADESCHEGHCIAPIVQFEGLKMQSLITTPATKATGKPLDSGSRAVSVDTPGSMKRMSSTPAKTSEKSTPPVMASISPEIHSGSLVIGTPAIFGAGHVVARVSDRRKCKPRGILTVGKGDETLGFSEGCEIRVSSLLDPEEASMKWLQSPKEVKCDQSTSPKNVTYSGFAGVLSNYRCDPFHDIPFSTGLNAKDWSFKLDSSSQVTDQIGDPKSRCSNTEGAHQNSRGDPYLGPPCPSDIKARGKSFGLDPGFQVIDQFGDSKTSTTNSKGVTHKREPSSKCDVPLVSDYMAKYQIFYLDSSHQLGKSSKKGPSFGGIPHNRSSSPLSDLKLDPCSSSSGAKNNNFGVISDRVDVHEFSGFKGRTSNSEWVPYIRGLSPVSDLQMTPSSNLSEGSPHGLRPSGSPWVVSQERGASSFKVRNSDLCSCSPVRRRSVSGVPSQEKTSSGFSERRLSNCTDRATRGDLKFIESDYVQDGSTHRYKLSPENSPFSCESSGNRNLIRTPSPDNSSDFLPLPGLSFAFSCPLTPHNSTDQLRHQNSLKAPCRHEFNEAYCEEGEFSSPTYESLSQMRISWREGLVSRIFEQDELDEWDWMLEEGKESDSCEESSFECKLGSDQKILAPQLVDSFEFIHEKRDDVTECEFGKFIRPVPCAESISTEGVVASSDSDWNLCYKNQLFE
ncbi:uncharacterized protein LOC18448599 [Amborella trichopoda]|uniref:Uncharacterized protein n=1 Tax=Amborella trichopoda TaxID=13333 RepID=U5DCD0_AMBTC|nr:uncharacterized protein LOC18448599 [Amborella trichopoda]ERN20189.1 hypothetical protein AMTR_s00066p00114140 [Amborella trichopoda]|eukprot:XP_006858722.1 uncharacterized protein LOC18448599 [Amborella trichopoda]